jgi:hypothetical protein
MVWGGISIDGRIELVVVPQRLNEQIYVETILQEHVVPFANNFGDDFILQQDNCRVHTANLAVNFLQDQEIHVSGKFLECSCSKSNARNQLLENEIARL